MLVQILVRGSEISTTHLRPMLLVVVPTKVRRRPRTMNWIVVVLYAASVLLEPILGYTIEFSISTTNTTQPMEDHTPAPYDNEESIPAAYTKVPTSECYDFIVIGSGAAGAVIANRLSENPSWRVLLLEAGYTENDLVQCPANAPLLQFTDYNWGYTTEPQDNICLAMDEQRCSWPRGKALGGSTVINFMIYTRGNPQDYDRWAAMGNPGWSYHEVLPYFLKSEDSHLTNQSNSGYHHKGGYQSVETPYASPLADGFIQAGRELGYETVDFNSPQQIGFSKMQATLQLGRRQSSAMAFLEPILQRNNLRILTQATVTKILIDPTTKRAYGVAYNRHNRNFVAMVKKEVVLSAGVLNSPQILMLSGVGPRAHLEELGIDVLNDLPVGQTLYDHVGFFGLVLNTHLNTQVNLFDPALVSQWYHLGEGPLASTAGSEALAFLQTNASIETWDYPDVELILLQSLTADNGTVFRKTLRISDQYYENNFAPFEGYSSFSILPVLLHPKSKGFMKLRSSNPFDYPLFFGNYLTDPDGSDARTLIAAIRFVEKLVETSALQELGVEMNKKTFVECGHLAYNSDEYWQCALKFTASTMYHYISTCKMGPSHDPTAVVDHELKVYGIANLRVADSSIIPMPLSAHTSAPSTMVGEKASDLIKKQWGFP